MRRARRAFWEAVFWAADFRLTLQFAAGQARTFAAKKPRCSIRLRAIAASHATSRRFPHRADCSTSQASSTTSRRWSTRSEEHTSELQSRGHLVCRLLLEKKKLLI